MKLALLRIRDSLRDSFWFLPLIMALLAAVGAFASVAFDHAIGEKWVANFGFIWSGGPDGARSVLSTVAGSLMTVISIVFSLTITTLAQTSSHFGPRVLRNFTSNRGVQFTLGTFIATFIFCLLVLRTVRSVNESQFVPYLSVNIGIVLTLISLGVLIFFIHHIAQSIQAETLTADVGRAILRSVPGLFPKRLVTATVAGHETRLPPPTPPTFEWENARVVSSRNTGYVQNIDEGRLLRLATEQDRVIRLRARAGDFLWSGAVLIDVLPASPVIDEFEDALAGSFSIGSRRTPDQDAVYGVQQLVEIAAHALSPGINEPFTALSSIDWLGAALAEVAGREFPALVSVDENNAPRVLARALDFRDLMHASFDQIRAYGSANADVMMRLLDVIIALAPLLSRVRDVETLAYHANLVATDASHIDNAYDRQRVIARHEVALGVFAQATTLCASSA
ncbi:MAG: DUF2254 domain-containing protein [Gemmatimonadaceae bacterium]